MEITKREILLSIVIVCVMLIIGFVVQQQILTAITNKNKEYDTAIKINDTDIFKYSMSTNVGNAFVEGAFFAVDPVSNVNLEGEWLYIEKIEKRHTMHTRVVTHTVNGKARTKTETYWTWDEVGSEEWHSKMISFCGVEFPYDKIIGFNAGWIKTDTYGKTKYEWYAIPVNHKGTIYTKLCDGTITQANMHEGKNAIDTYKSMIINETLCIIGFWICWIALIVFIVICFYRLENEWIE